LPAGRALLRTLKEVRDDRRLKRHLRGRGRHRDVFVSHLAVVVARELHLVFPLLAGALAPGAREAVAHLVQLVLREWPLEMLVQRVEQRAHKLL